MMDDLQEELQQALPLEIEQLVPPFSIEDSRDKQFKAAHNALRRSIKLKNRMLSLINAYYLGKILNEFETSTLKFQNKRKLTVHYAVMAEYTYDIFEPYPTKILHTTSISVQRIKKLSRTQVLLLRETVESSFYEQ